MTIYVTADWHLGEDRFDIMARPFTSADEMVDEFVRLHNVIVKPEDELWMVGDVCYQKKPEYLPHVARFNGKKTLFRGNHDRGISDEAFSKYFDRIIPEGDGHFIQVQGLTCYVTHYPSQGKVKYFNLVGHIHHAWKYQLNMFNIGVDANHFRPVNLETIPSHFKAICDFYDEDVWCAYSSINSTYQGTRGKHGMYFHPEG